MQPQAILPQPSWTLPANGSGQRASSPSFAAILDRQRPSVAPGAANIPSALEPQEAAKPIVLGTITNDEPTVSDLLIKHPEYGKDCWRIIHASINEDKPYTRIQAGSVVTLDPDTLEINWHKKGQLPQDVKMAAHHPAEPRQGLTEPKAPPPADLELANAVTPYMGSPYDKINCYGLVVRGLKNLGVQYGGQGGLRDRLVNMALSQGLPDNAYMNGEGLIKASGDELYAKSFMRVKNSETEARQVIEEIKPLLEKGCILSFSTPTKGHTGVISQQDELWTFINSGDLDHPLSPASPEKGVGEETLADEILNWFQRAFENKESLQITLGKLKSDKLAAFIKQNPSRTFTPA